MLRRGFPYALARHASVPPELLASLGEAWPQAETMLREAGLASPLQLLVFLETLWPKAVNVFGTACRNRAGRPTSPQVPEDNSVFSRTTLHAALGGGDVATS